MTSVLVLNGPEPQPARHPQARGVRATTLADVEACAGRRRASSGWTWSSGSPTTRASSSTGSTSSGRRSRPGTDRRRLQPRRVHPHLGGAARRHRGREPAGGRAAHLECPRAGGVPAPLVHLAGGARDHRGFRCARLFVGDQRPLRVDPAGQLTARPVTGVRLRRVPDAAAGARCRSRHRGGAPRGG